MDKYITIKLLNSEEIICILMHENEHEIQTMFPMLVKTFPKMAPNGRMGESITLAPYSYFAADDYFNFSKHQIICIKDLAPHHINSYKLAIEDFVNGIEPGGDQPLTAEELDKLTKQLGDMFKQTANSVEDPSDDLPALLVTNDTKQTIH